MSHCFAVCCLKSVCPKTGGEVYPKAHEIPLCIVLSQWSVTFGEYEVVEIDDVVIATEVYPQTVELVLQSFDGPPEVLFVHELGFFVDDSGDQKRAAG